MLISRGIEKILRELAEGLESTGTYLFTARELTLHGVERDSAMEALEMALVELAHAQSALHRLRAGLSSRAVEFSMTDSGREAMLCDD